MQYLLYGLSFTNHQPLIYQRKPLKLKSHSIATSQSQLLHCLELSYKLGGVRLILLTSQFAIEGDIYVQRK